MKKCLCIVPLVLLLCFTIACQDKAAMAELEQLRAKEIAELKNEAIFRQFHEALDSQDIGRFISFLAPGAVCHGAGPQEDLTAENVSLFLKPFFKAIPDLTHTIEDIYSKGDKVVARILIQGTHKAELMGIPPTGNRVRYYQISMAQIVDGKIKEGWRITDSLGMMQQLGMELRPKEVKK
ncbi:MAG: ester cyclase [Candidatus Aminicenantes bacterium]|nr:ester cyclase [Candidatus Aminicenantes bacterium]